MQVVAKSGESIDMEACFSQLTLDVIGKAVFNYDFNALNTDSPLIQVPLRTAAHFCFACWSVLVEPGLQCPAAVDGCSTLPMLYVAY